MKRILHYAALFLGLLISLFFILFSFDSFPKELDMRSIAGFIIHAAPAILIAVFSLISYRFPKTGFILFLIGAVAFTVFFKTYRNIQYFTLLTLPLVVIAMMLLASVQKRSRN